MILSIHQHISKLIGAAPDLVKTLLVLVLSAFMAPLFSFMSKPQLRYLYSIIPGIIFIFYMVEIWGFYVMATILAPFIFIKLMPKYSFEAPTFISLLFLIFVHVYRFIYDDMTWKIDCSVIIMYQFTKVTYYGFYIKKQKKNPQLIPYLAHCLFFPSVTIGPTYSFQVFMNFIKNGDKCKIPSFSQILFNSVKTIILFSITAVALKVFTPQFVIQNQTYTSLPFYAQFLSLNIIGFFYRIKFYSAWSLAQLSIDLAGLSWNEKNQSHDLVITGSIQFQIEPNIKNKTEYWNTSVQIWIKQIIFTNLKSAIKSNSLATFLTFFISAFWHGLYLTYYIGFMQWAIIIIITKWGYKCSLVLPKFANLLWVKSLSFLVMSTLFNYTGMIMITVHLKQTFVFCSNMKFIGHFVLVFLLVVSMVVKPSFFKKKKEE